MTPAAARLLLEQLERSGIGAPDWPVAAKLRRSLLCAAARDSDAGAFEQQFRALGELRGRCRREGWCSGTLRREVWREVNADLREGCVRLVASGHAPSVDLLTRALRTAIADEQGEHLAPELLSAATQQAVLAGAARRARRLLRIIERDLRSPDAVLATVPGGIERCLDASERMSSRFGPDARRAALVHSLGAGWLMRSSAAKAVEALDRRVTAADGGTRVERDAWCMALAIASHAWDVLGDARESLRLMGSAKHAIRRGFIRRWGSCPACADAVARVVGLPG